MARHNLTRARIFGIGLAVVSLAFAACSKSSSTSSSTGGETVPTAVPTSTSSPNGLSSPCALSLGQAYVPDGGNGVGSNGVNFNGVQVSRFEDNSQNLCATAPVQPATVVFQSSVGTVAFSADFTDGIALLRSTAGGYSLVQDLFGANVAQLVPVGTPYDLAVAPTAAPTAPGASPTPIFSPGVVPLIADATSATIVGSSSSGLAFTLGADANPPAIVALTSLANAPPQYGSAVPFAGGNYTLKNVPAFPRSIVRVAPGGGVLLARGPSDLLSFALSTQASGYLANAQADDTTLGYGTGTFLRGTGAIAFDPADSTRALIGGGSSSALRNTVTLVTGLPGAITETRRVTVPGTTVRSIVISNNGAFGVVGTDAGVAVLSGVNTGVLALVASSPALTMPRYTTCAGLAARMTNVFSVGLSAGAAAGSTTSTLFYLVALGMPSVAPAGANCVHPASIVAFPFNTTTGLYATPVPLSSPTASATAPPKTFTQNNVIAPPTGADFMVVH